MGGEPSHCMGNGCEICHVFKETDTFITKEGDETCNIKVTNLYFNLDHVVYIIVIHVIIII